MFKFTLRTRRRWYQRDWRDLRHSDRRPQWCRIDHRTLTILANSDNGDQTVDRTDPDFVTACSACASDKFRSHLRRHWPLKEGAQRMIQALVPADGIDELPNSIGNPIGFGTKQVRRPGTLLDYVCTEKEKHPEKIILVRVGEFFEAFGMDALLLVEHCGLNAMGQKARAGCPRSNVQQTLDGLTSVGLTVAVYEEVEGIGNYESSKLARASSTSPGGGLKQRYLAQVVSPSAPTYIHGAILDQGSIEFRDASIYVGVQVSARGATTSSSVSDTRYGSRAEGSLHYTVYEVSLESRFIRISERLTEDAARCLVESSNISDGDRDTSKNMSIFFANPPGLGGVAGISNNEGNVLDSGASNTRGSALRGIPARAKRIIAPGMQIDRLRRAEEDPRSFLSEMLKKISNEIAMPEVANVDNFRIVSSNDSISESMLSTNDLSHVRPRPLYAPTAQQLGLLPSPQVPDLVASLLPANDAPSCSRTFLRRWLMRPPPPFVADEMLKLLSTLKNMKSGLPTIRTTLTAGKVVALCSSHQANAQMFRDLRRILNTATSVLSLPSNSKHDDDKDLHTNLVNSLVSLLGHECGVKMMSDILLEQCHSAIDRIDQAIVDYQFGGRGASAKKLEDDFWLRCMEDWSLQQISEDTGISRADLVDPKRDGSGLGISILRKNELDFRSALKPEASSKVQEVFLAVDDARCRLFDALWNDFAIDSQQPSTVLRNIKFDQLNNTVYLLKKPADKRKNSEISEWIHPKDRNGRPLPARYTTCRVEEAMASYAGACEDARIVTREELRQLCSDFVNKQLLLCGVAAIHLNEILLTGSLHVRESLRRGWMLPVLEPLAITSDTHALPPVTISLKEIWPYWLGGNTAVRNNIDLHGQWIVTGPNMSGKSTLLRSVTAVALLANCGLAVPANMSSSDSDNVVPIPRLDGYFLRTNGADCPAEGLSAFALEADDMRILLRDVTPRSLAAVDELGRGTAPREGAAIVGAVLEELDKRGCPSLFATHLQEELCALPLTFARTKFKVLRAEESDTNSKRSTQYDSAIRYEYHLDDGICHDSFSLSTAMYHDVPQHVIDRAAELRSSKQNGQLEHNRHSNCDSVVNNVKIADTKLPEVPESLDRTTSDLSSAIEIIIGLSPEIDSENITVLEPHWEAPPRLAAGTACLYLLEITEGNCERVSPSFYLGETEHLADRLKSHRQRFGSDSVRMVVFPLTQGGRSEARSCEARGIVELHRAGFSLQNIAS